MDLASTANIMKLWEKGNPNRLGGAGGFGPRPGGLCAIL